MMCNGKQKKEQRIGEARDKIKLLARSRKAGTLIRHEYNNASRALRQAFIEYANKYGVTKSDIRYNMNRQCLSPA